MKVKRKEAFDAIQWFKIGDEPIGEPGNFARHKPDALCPKCNKPRKEHGNYGGLICSGTWFVKDGWMLDYGLEWSAYSPRVFDETFEEV